MIASGFNVRVGHVFSETDRIKSYRLLPTETGTLPAFTAGAHIDVTAPNGMIRQYSLCNPPGDTDHYQIAVLREESGRGGSASMHDDVQEGSTLRVGSPRNHFPLRNDAQKYILLAGGIGVTPLLSMAWQIQKAGMDFEFHYCCRSNEDAAFRNQLLSAPFSGKVFLHPNQGEQANRLDLDTLLATPQEGAQIYCCGPERFTDAITKAARDWPENSLFMERFTAVSPDNHPENQPFDIEIASTGEVVNVPADKSILQVLRAQGIEKESLCEDGLCGSCETGLLAGQADHRDSIQTDAEKQENTSIMVCCSRARNSLLKLDI